MKKLLSLILVTMLCVCALASCAVVDTVKGWLGIGEDPGEVIEYNLPAAVEYVRALYINDNPVTSYDYEVVGQVMVKAVKYTVDWSVDNDKVKLTKGETKWTVDIDEDALSEYNYVLTATVTAGDGSKDTVSFNRTVPEKNIYVGVANPVEGTAYKFFMNQVNKNQILYAVGTFGEKYLDTTQVATEAPDFYVEKSGDGFKFYFLDGETRMYIEAYLVLNPDDGHYSKRLKFSENGTVWTYNGETKSWWSPALAETGSQYVIGTYGEFTTFSISETSYITAENTGKEQFPAGLILKELAETDNSTPEEKIDNELAAVEMPTDIYNDTTITLPVAGGRYPGVAFTWASNNECAVVNAEGNALAVTLPAEATTITLTLTATIDGVSNTKEFTINVAAKTNIIPVIVDAPVDGQEYYFMLTQKNLNKDLYFKAEMNGFYYATVESYLTASTIKVIALEDGKYDLQAAGKYLSVVEEYNEEKAKYYQNVVFLDAAPENKFVWNTEYKTFTIKLGETDYYLGTYNQNSTISASKLSFAATSFVAHLVKMLPDSDGQLALTPDNLGLESTYKADEVEVEGVKVGYTELYFKDAGIQMRNKNGNISSIWNITEFAYAIARIELVYNSGKDPRIEDMLTIAFGNDETLSGGVAKVTGVEGQTKYVITPDKYTYTFFKITHCCAGGSLYWDEIKIVLVNDESYEPHVHVFGDPTCTEPAKCECGETQGEANGHSWNDATCTTPKTCSVCNITEGEAKGHAYGEDGVCANGCGISQEHVCEFDDATCTTPKTCPVCNATEGDALGHDYQGATCTVKGICSRCQAEGDVLPHIDETGDYKCDREGCTELVLPAVDSVLTIAEALKIGELYKNTTGASYAPNKYYIVGEITALTSTKYGTCKITDETGTIDIYGLKDSTGTTIYENLGVKPVVGDIVKIYGKLGAFKQSVQFDNSNIIEHTAHTCVPGAEATCTTAQTCTICAKVIVAAPGHDYQGATCTQPAICSVCQNEGDTLDHVYVDGVCSGCGASETEAPAAQYVKVNSAAEFTSGQYVVIANDVNITLSEISGTWIVGEELAVTNGVIAKKTGDSYAITLNVTDAGVTIKIGDQFVAPKAGNNNGIVFGTEYVWAYEFDADGNIIFKGVGDDVSQLAYNRTNSNPGPGFRSYKISTLTGTNGGNYNATFSVYKLVE